MFTVKDVGATEDDYVMVCLDSVGNEFLITISDQTYQEIKEFKQKLEEV